MLLLLSVLFISDGTQEAFVFLPPKIDVYVCAYYALSSWQFLQQWRKESDMKVGREREKERERWRERLRVNSNNGVP